MVTVFARTLAGVALWVISRRGLLGVSAGTTQILPHHVGQIRRAIRHLALKQEITSTSSRPAIVREIYDDLHQIAHRQQKLTQLITAEDFSLRAIRGSMVEGVLVANRDLTISLANDRLTTMFSLSRNPVGRTLMEAFRNHVLQQMAKRTVETEAPQYAELPVDIREKDGFVA